jgi:putative NADPH-quinone reductase
MKVLVVHAHPVEESFNTALRRTIVETLIRGGHDVRLLDLYGEGFSPALTRRERLDYHDPAINVTPVQAYVDQLHWAEGLVLVYPTWWYGMPAMLKGWFDRVWLPGVTFDVVPDQPIKPHKMSNIRRFAVVTTYGSPWWLVRFYLGDPVRKVLGRGVRRLMARDCRFDWHALYRMDDVGQPERAAFLAKVAAAFSRF